MLFAPIRRSFAARLLVAFMGAVGVLLLATLLVVRAETERQVRVVVAVAVERSEAAFRETEEFRRRRLQDHTDRFDQIRAMAALEAALEAGDPAPLLEFVEYETQLIVTATDPDPLQVFAGLDGRPVLTRLGATLLEGADPAGVGPLLEGVLAGNRSDPYAYVVVQGRVYDVEARTVHGLSGAPLGALAVGVPVEARALGSVGGVEVCFVMEGGCLAGTALARERLAPVMTRIAGTSGTTRVQAAGERWAMVTEALNPARPAAGDRVIAVPLGPVMAPFLRISRSLLLAGAGALVLALLASILMARSFTRPVRALVDATGRVAAGDYTVEVDAGREDELGSLGRAFNEMTLGLRLKERYRGVLDKVVSREIAEELTRGELVLGGETRRATVLFADIRGFTGLTQGMEPQEVVGLVNACMEILAAAVEAEGGVVDKFVGDEIMAVWGAPVAHGDDPARAVRSAARMREGMEGFNRRQRGAGGPVIELGIGINTGTVVAGNTGSSNRMNYTVLGDEVNLASRLCSAAGPGEILISGATRAGVAEEVPLRPAGERTLKGFARPVPVFELDGTPAMASRGRVAPVLAALVTGSAVWVAGMALGSAEAAAQEGDLPTLRDLGLAWASEDGRFQLDVSGRLDLELYLPSEDPAWIIPATDPLFAPRLRVFLDAFAGDHLYGLVELRADRGPGPGDSDLEGRVEQAFVRVGPGPWGMALQAGRFASPFGTYPVRHHTVADAFIRPPPGYDYRTMICPGIVPPDMASFVGWKDDPDFFRPLGAPPVWGAPYPWGAMLTAPVGPVDLRAAYVNSSPSSEPWRWDWNGEGWGDGSAVLGASAALSPALRLDVSWNRGPYLLEELGGGGTLPPGRRAADYVQEIWSLGATYSRGPAVLRGEVLHDRWEVPNAGEPTEVSWHVEAQTDLMAGLFVAGRLGGVRFLSLEGPAGQAWDWDYDVLRGQIAGGYRIVRNLEVRGELMLTEQAGPHDPDADLLSFQVWWAF